MLSGLCLTVTACGDAGQEAEERGGLEIPRGLGKADADFSCKGHCGGKAAGCYCDSECAKFGDCCPDKVQVCDGQGKLCGGIAGIPCQAGQKCRLDGAYPDAAGKCVPNDYCVTKDDCKFLVHPMCLGDWTCQNNKCVFKCGPVPTKCISNNDCASGEYCELGDGMCRNPIFALLEGVCKKRPVACSEIYAPVCGCDGKTYDSDCHAHAAGVSVGKQGECEPPQPKVCGPIPNGQCDPGYVCDIHSCLLGATGTCVPLPKCDPAFQEPVCGCNGITYNNDCLRRAAGVPLNHQGACQPTGTKCWTDANCKTGEYCALKPGECLLPTFNLLQGTCTKKPEACITLYVPVCGCDGKTYDNECVAASSGVNVASKGECAKPKQYCAGFCGSKSPEGCYCDAACAKYGDCCPDQAQVCAGK